MRTLKRTLCLVLAMVMVLGMFGIASATSFKDDGKVQYKEAVDVMTGIGSINGMGDGTFNPAGNVTRAQAAKMVAYAVLGENVAKTLPATASSFKDVDSNFVWAIPSIEYLVKAGVINGRGDGTFDPNGKVTAYEIAKMLLCAAGYGKKGEFTGNSWSLNVAITAQKQGVFTGSKAADRNAAATREECALYCFNGLTKVAKVVWDKDKEAYEVLVPGTFPDNNGDGVRQIAEEVYPKLIAQPTTENGRTGYYWMLNGKYISSFVVDDSVLATSTNGTSFANLTTPTSSKYIKVKPDTAVTYYYQDTEVTATYPTGATGADDDAKLADNISKIEAKAATKGVIVNFVDTDDNGKYDTVSVIEKSVDRLATPPVVKTVGSKTTVTLSASILNVDADNISYPADLAKGDVILYYAVGSHYYVEKAAKVDGDTVSSYTAAYVTINNANYAASALTGTELGSADDLTDLQALMGKKGYSFYTDNGGNICYVVAPDAAAVAENTVFVMAMDAPQSFGKYSYKAAVVKPDGTQEIMAVKKTAKAGGTLTALSEDADARIDAATPMDNGKLKAFVFYTFAKNDDGSYNLTEATNQSAKVRMTSSGTVATGALADGDYAYSIAAKEANFLKKSTYAAATSWGAGVAEPNVANAGTSFLYYDASAKTFTVKTGIANALSYTANENTKIFILNEKNNAYASVVIAMGSSTTSPATGFDQVFVASAPTVTYDANGTELYTHKAVVNGEEKTVTTYDNDWTVGQVWFVKEYAANGAVKADTAKTVAQATGVASGLAFTDVTDLDYAGGTLTVTSHNGGTALKTSYVLKSATKIFFLNNTDITNPTISAVSAEQAASLIKLYAADDNEEITLVPTSTTDTDIAIIYLLLK